jgi:hypothetical protein
METVTMQTPTDTAQDTATALPTMALQHLMHVQQIQLQTLLAWQRSLFAIQQDWFDRWSSRFAGAARIDD